ncbi:MAG: hypothetical protein GEU87_14500 [Alphaproteobacteria bacterium]|nr:hypothetical protein [Alphaproteobacteria bacterium]
MTSCHDKSDVHEIEPIAVAYESFCQALEALHRAQHDGGTDHETGLTAGQAARAYYKSMAKVLRAFNAPNNWRRDDSAKVPLPRLVGFTVGDIFEDLVAGSLPLNIKHLFFGRGRSGIKAVQRQAIAAAVRYVEAARLELIRDTRPIKRVAKEFGVTEKTVRLWVTENPEAKELLRRFQNQPESGSMLERHMREDARHYRNSRHVKTRK